MALQRVPALDRHEKKQVKMPPMRTVSCQEDQAEPVMCGHRSGDLAFCCAAVSEAHKEKRWVRGEVWMVPTGCSAPLTSQPPSGHPPLLSPLSQARAPSCSFLNRDGMASSCMSSSVDQIPLFRHAAAALT